jgi:hypothetical protein
MQISSRRRLYPSVSLLVLAAALAAASSGRSGLSHGQRLQFGKPARADQQPYSNEEENRSIETASLGFG